jgi:hypothetical protein
MLLQINPPKTQPLERMIHRKACAKQMRES